MKRTPLTRNPGTARASVPAIRQKRCDKRRGGCGEMFTPARPMQKACGLTCAHSMVRLANDKAAAKVRAQDKRQTRAQLEALKSRRQWINETQAAFNAWVRLRDAGQPCISCGRLHGGKVNAGHYRSTGAAPELRFEPLNVHLQCEPCNTHLSGNLIPYRVNLLARIGAEQLAWIEGPHAAQKWTIEQLRGLRDDYRAKVRAMKKEQA